MSAALVADIEVRRGAFRLQAAIEVRPGERIGVVGPNGSGKSTLLRAIAGLVELHSGHLRLGDRVLADDRTDRPPEERRIGFMFQDHRLFPHLNALDNVAFGPRSRGMGRAAARRTATEWLDRLECADLASLRTGQLSGGQAQRVALARALAQAPQALLLDEPMAALDAAARLEVRTYLSRHLRELEIPTVLVTHDPVEALVMTDRLVVLEGGRVVQTGSPAQVADRPLTPYVAGLLGLNLYAGRVVGRVVELDGGGVLSPAVVPDAARVFLTVRPSAISVHLDRPAGGSPRNVWRAVISSVEAGAENVRLRIAGEPDALVDVTAAAVNELGLAPGRPVWLSLKASETNCYEDPAAMVATPKLRA